MAKSASISTLIDADVKKALNAYCKRRGQKIRFVIEDALIDKLEDEIDLEAYRLRKNEATYSLEEVLNNKK